MHLKWPRWFDVYFADPNAVLIEIVHRGNATLACMWMAVELKYNPKFTFSVEVSDDSVVLTNTCRWFTYSVFQATDVFFSLLRDLEDTSYLKHAYAYSKDLPIERIIDSLISSHWTVSKLLNLVSTVLSIKDLSEDRLMKYYALLIGLNMISCIEREEQVILILPEYRGSFSF